MVKITIKSVLFSFFALGVVGPLAAPRDRGCCPTARQVRFAAYLGWTAGWFVGTTYNNDFADEWDHNIVRGFLALKAADTEIRCEIENDPSCCNFFINLMPRKSDLNFLAYSAGAVGMSILLASQLD